MRPVGQSLSTMSPCLNLAGSTLAIAVPLFDGSLPVFSGRPLEISRRGKSLEYETLSMSDGLDWLTAPVLELRPRLMRRANCRRNLILQTAGQLAHAGTLYREEPKSRGPLHQIVPLQRLIW
jgi:hypothetical protein